MSHSLKSDSYRGLYRDYYRVYSGECYESRLCLICESFSQVEEFER